MVAIYVLYTSFHFHFLQIGKYIPELTECLVYMNDLFEFLALEEENDYLGQNIEKIQSKDLSMPTAVSLADISFGYANGQTIINHLSVSFENGKMTAITGRTGCGKSTLLKLICGFYPVTGGEIFLFGKKLSEIGYEEARRQIAYVPQEPYLYQTTIEENIAYGKPGASTEEIMNAARAATPFGSAALFTTRIFTMLSFITEIFHPPVQAAVTSRPPDSPPRQTEARPAPTPP